MGKKYKFAIWFNAAYVLLGFFTTVIALLQKGPNVCYYIMLGIDLVIYAHVGYYALKGYKKPHGNLLRNMMIVFVLSQTLKPVLENDTFTGQYYTACMLSIGLVAFMAGRLNKIKQNRFIAVIVLALFVYVSSVYMSFVPADQKALGFFKLIPIYNRVTMWIALASAYFTRFLEHKEAGLEDAPNK